MLIVLSNQVEGRDGFLFMSASPVLTQWLTQRLTQRRGSANMAMRKGSEKPGFHTVKIVVFSFSD